MANKKEGIALIFLALTLIFSPLVLGAGVATPYWDDNPLKLAAGESTIATISLQNAVGDEDRMFSAEIISGKELAELTETEFFVPLGSEIPVNIKIKIPDDAEKGKVYEISISFKQTGTEEGGMVHVAGAFTSKLPVEVVSYEESHLRLEQGGGLNPIWTGVIILLLITLISVFVIKKRKNRK